MAAKAEFLKIKRGGKLTESQKSFVLCNAYISK